MPQLQGLQTKQSIDGEVDEAGQELGEKATLEDQILSVEFHGSKVAKQKVDLQTLGWKPVYVTIKSRLYQLLFLSKACINFFFCSGPSKLFKRLYLYF